MNARSTSRGIRRVQLPTLAAGLVAGALLAGGLAPLLGNDVELATSGSTPGFLDGTSTTVTVAPGSGGEADGGAGSGATSSTVPTAGGGTTATTAPVARTASDVGVTADAIKLGALLMKCDQCGAVGYDFPKTGPQIVRAFAKDINDRGGINGRRVDVVVKEFDQLADVNQGGASQRRACLELTEQHKVFAAITEGATQLECLYDEHETTTLTLTPAIADDPGAFNASNGRLWAIAPSARRMLVSWVDQLIAKGHLAKNKPFGVVTMAASEFDQPIRQYLVPYLQQLGYPPAQVTVLPADPAAAATARATEGAAMRSKGVGTVLLAVDFFTSALWVQEAERNSWKPQYHVSDYGTQADESTAKSQPSSFAGTIAISWAPTLDGGNSPAADACRKVWEAAAGRPTAGDEEELIVNQICNMFLMFERGATLAGVNLTRTTLAQGLSRVGPIPLAGVAGGSGTLGGAYKFGPARWSAVDQYVVKRWDGSKYVQVGAPGKMSA